MQPFTTVTAVAAPLDQANVDTDQVIPARFLTRPRSAGMADCLFHDLRYDEQGAARPGFVLNRPPFDAARILVAGRNFGCGSSREDAVYALADHGFRAVIAPSFGDIFHSNCFKNGFLPVRLDDATCAAMRAHLNDHPGATVTIDLANQTVTGPDGRVHRFEVDPFGKDCLLEGLDEIDLTLRLSDDIARFEAEQARTADWV